MGNAAAGGLPTHPTTSRGWPAALHGAPADHVSPLVGDEAAARRWMVQARWRDGLEDMPGPRVIRGGHTTYYSPKEVPLMTGADVHPFSDQETALARAWIADCQWADLDEDLIVELPTPVVWRGVARHYAGGVAQFLEDVHQASDLVAGTP